LILDICGGEAGPVDDQIVNIPRREPVKMRVSRANRIIGIAIGADEIAQIFTRLGLTFEREGDTFAVMPPSIPGLCTTGGFEFYVQNRGTGDPRATDAALKGFIDKARQRPELQGVNTTFRANSQQLFVDLDRSKAEALGVRVGDAFQAMQTLFGSAVGGQFSQFSRVWFVILQADAEYRANPDDFQRVFVRSASGANIPLSSLITTRYVASPKLVTRFNGFPAVKITGDPAPGFSSGQAIRAMEAIAKETLPADFAYAWAGQALQEKESGSTSSSAFIFGLIVVFLLLAAQFEKWTLPIAVVLTVPFAVLGALLLTWALGLENAIKADNDISLVGLFRPTWHGGARRLQPAPPGVSRTPATRGGW